MPDMLVNLYDMPKIDMDAKLAEDGIVIKRAMAFNMQKIKDYVKVTFAEDCPDWVNECECAIFNSPPSCYIALQNGELVGFACYDASALGLFGPTGVSPSMRGKGVGKALLGRCLETMKEMGYAYAVIGYVTDAIPFYEKAVNATVIEGSSVEKSVYFNLI